MTDSNCHDNVGVSDMGEGRQRRILTTALTAIGASVVIVVPLAFALLAGLVSSSDCGLTLFGVCTSASPWWVSAKFFLAAAILVSVPVVAGSPAWKRSSSWGFAATGLLILGVIVIYAPTLQP